MTMIRKSMIALGAMAVIMAGATPTLARDTSARHFGYGAFAYYGPSYSYGQRSRNSSRGLSSRGGAPDDHVGLLRAPVGQRRVSES